MPTRDGAFTVFGGAILTAFGFVSLACSSYLSGAIQLSTGDYIRLWSDSILAVVLGFLVILAGDLIASKGRSRKVWGAVMGTIASIIGGFNSLVLTLMVVGVQSQSFVITSSSSAQLGAAVEILILGCIITLFVGFPFGMFGSAPGVMERESELLESTESSA